MANSEHHVSQRHEQFVNVLHSYVRLIIVELHEPITKSMQFDDDSKYLEIREKTFSSYEKLIARSNLSSIEMLRQGSDFSRELFQMELQIKQLQNLLERFVYPLYDEATNRTK